MRQQPQVENRYREAVRTALECLGDDLMLEDVDVLCEYLVLRFLKTSPRAISGASLEGTLHELQEFVRKLYPVLLTFVSMVNTSAMPCAGGAQA